MTEKFIFREKRKTVKLCCSDIVYFESYGHYITIYLKDKSTHTTRCTISALTAMLDKETFVRVHRGIVVNLSYVNKINYLGAFLKDGYGRVSVSRSCREIAEEAFRKFKNSKP
ncbi:MAG: LytTR family transcriptional regulator [Clostridia bacterium]|nr:LytTR family transcriptional regulator [Clostridia bacterium]